MHGAYSALDMRFDVDTANEPTASGWVRDARQSIRAAPIDFFRVNPARYWADFLVALSLAYGAAAFYLLAPLGSWTQVAAFPIAVFWFYRLGSLIHEVCHLRHHEMRTFKVAWNLLVGTLTLTPSPFFTRHHRDHHSQRIYGTREDPEYVANVLTKGSVGSAVGYGLAILCFPLCVALRFLLAPLTFLHPRLRQWTLERASSFTLNTRYRRRVNAFDRKAIMAVELLCFARLAFVLVSVHSGAAPPSRIPLLYMLGLTTLIMNQMRQLADHHFAGDGSPTGIEAHILDSCNFTGRDPLTWLLFPFSIRYHALHHLFPSLPYHNLAAAHSHLVATLPLDSPYRGLDQPGWWAVARTTVFGR